MTVTVTSSVANPYRHTITAGKHTFYADTTPANGGQDTAPTPHELLLGALGACTSMTLQMYAGRKGWDVQDITVSLSESSTTQTDPATGASKKIPKIEKDIQIKGNLSAAEKTRLEQVAEACPVNKLIRDDKAIASNFDYVI